MTNETRYDFLKQLYQEKLELAKGEWSINQFARAANISPGNLWKMLHGQVAQPETLQKIANARPDLEYLLDELMYAAGHTVDTPGSLKSTHYDSSTNDPALLIPVLENLVGPKNKILSSADNKRYYFPKSKLGKGRHFFYRVTNDEMSPKVKNGDLVLFDMDLVPKDGDLVLFRLNKTEGMVRYFSKQNTKFIAYTANPQYAPIYYGKSEVEIFGVAISAVVHF